MIQFLAKLTRYFPVNESSRSWSIRLFRRKALLVASVVAVLLSQTVDAESAEVESNKRPNIILILADDMGYSDLGCMGAEIETPNLDSMAAGGVLFTHFYNTSRCCPSRACLLTGQYQWDAGIGHMISNRSKLPEYASALNEENVTIAEALREDGYQTVMAGKWHVGDARENWPDHRGFENFFGTPNGGGLYFYPSKFYDRPIYRDGILVRPNPGWYSTDGFTDYAIEYVETLRDRERPFFMYLAYIAPHFPLQAKAKDIDKYRETYQAGYQLIRRARFRKQQSLGFFSGEKSPSPSTLPVWSSVKDRDQEALKMAVYAAQVDCLDQNVGRLMHALQEEQIARNTVVMFLSDNGGCSSSFNRTPQAEIGTAQSNAAYGRWFNVSNTPFRMAKSQEHEGGVLTPLIMHWPAGIKKPGHRVHKPAHIMDVLPTCLDLAGTVYPTEYLSRKLDPLDGISFLPLARGETIDRDRDLFWEHQGNKAVRRGDWKLVALHKGPWELYNLADDPFETIDLAKKERKRVSNMASLYQAWALEHGVRPWPLKK